MNPKLGFIFFTLLALLIFSCKSNTAQTTETETNIPPSKTTKIKPSKNNEPLTFVEFVIKSNENSIARYVVNEQLVNLPSPNDAIGSTKDVKGKIILSENGQISTEQNSYFEVNMLSLKSDSNRRDNYLKRNSLESNTYPTASFQITKINNLPFPAPLNEKIDFELIGILTIKNISKEVTWNVSSEFDGNKLTGIAKTEFKFNFFEIKIPKVFVVVSVKDLIQLEIEFEALKVDQ